VKPISVNSNNLKRREGEGGGGSGVESLGWCRPMFLLIGVVVIVVVVGLVGLLGGLFGGNYESP
jgi:hypothetical protein